MDGVTQVDVTLPFLTVLSVNLEVIAMNITCHCHQAWQADACKVKVVTCLP
ncbi:hypothetical protein D3C86_2107690 [compost metagenome]